MYEKKENTKSRRKISQGGTHEEKLKKYLALTGQKNDLKSKKATKRTVDKSQVL